MIATAVGEVVGLVAMGVIYNISSDRSGDGEPKAEKSIYLEARAIMGEKSRAGGHERAGK